MKSEDYEEFVKNPPSAEELLDDPTLDPRFYNQQKQANGEPTQPITIKTGPRKKLGDEAGKTSHKAHGVGIRREIILEVSSAQFNLIGKALMGAIPKGQEQFAEQLNCDMLRLAVSQEKSYLKQLEGIEVYIKEASEAREQARENLGDEINGGSK
jgi:hypothetical protein